MKNSFAQIPDRFVPTARHLAFMLVYSIVFTVAVSMLSNPAFAQTCTPASTASGSLDTCFGSSGISVVVPPATSGSVQKATVQTDGKILVVAIVNPLSNPFSSFITRYNADGSLDTTFGNAGFVFLYWGSGGYAYAVGMQTVGGQERIVVAGSATSSVLIVERYELDGTIDTSFGTNGRTAITTGYALALAIQPWDQKILTMGDQSVLVRLNANGTRDSSFGKNGISQANSGVRAKGLAIQSNRRIIAAGYIGGDFAAARFNVDGTLDDGGRNDTTRGDSFGKSGKVTTDFFHYDDQAQALLVDANDKIIAAGSTLRATTSNSRDMAVVRYTASGQLDTSFGNGGKATVDFFGFYDAAMSAALQSDGKIVLLGNTLKTTDGTSRDFAIARFNSNGVLDASFGTAGRVSTDIWGGADYGYGGIVQIDSSCRMTNPLCTPTPLGLVIVGTVTNTPASYVAAARYIL